MKNQKGITLIALVVTIIVLLILAGVTIALLTGDNGIITNSTKAKEQTLQQQAVEEIKLGLNSIKTEVLKRLNDDVNYDPNSSSDTYGYNYLVTQTVTGISASNTAGTTTGYYVIYNSSTKAIDITYRNTDANFRVEGSITFGASAYDNGGTIGNVNIKQSAN